MTGIQDEIDDVRSLNRRNDADSKRLSMELNDDMMRHVHINEAAERNYRTAVHMKKSKKEIKGYRTKWRRIHRATMKRAKEDILGMRRIEAMTRLRKRWHKKQTKRMVRERAFEMTMRPQRSKEYENFHGYLDLMQRIHNKVKTPVKM